MSVARIISSLIALICLVALPLPGTSESVSVASLGAWNRLETHLFPERAQGSMTGTEFLKATAKLSRERREEAIFAQILVGNVPEFLRTLVPVSIDTGRHKAIVYVLPDYLAIGSNEDHVRIPMSPKTAMRIARSFGFTLPTRKLVDEIYKQSTTKLAPAPMRAGKLMASNAYYASHNQTIQRQMKDIHSSIGSLVAGHKKDVVITPRLSKLPKRVAIYGWHRPNGKPIQPLSLVHGINYADYSHGVRLVSKEAFVDGKKMDISEILSSENLNILISDEGAITLKSYL